MQWLTWGWILNYISSRLYAPYAVVDFIPKIPCGCITTSIIENLLAVYIAAPNQEETLLAVPKKGLHWSLVILREELDYSNAHFANSPVEIEVRFWNTRGPFTRKLLHADTANGTFVLAVRELCTWKRICRCFNPHKNFIHTK